MFIGILGGGLSGISLQHFLRHKSEVLEKEDRPGGLCRTFCKDSFYYDIGGHILFSKNQLIMNVIRKALKGSIICRRRNNKVFFKDRFVKYPFENGLSALDKQDAYECLLGYLKALGRKPKNFREWIYENFGEGIAEKYLLPYNKKIWKYPLDQMGIEWVERVPRPPLEDVVKSALGIETEGYLHQLYFNYPAKGGIESLINALIKEAKIVTCGFEVKSIKRKKGGWSVSDGKRQREYDKIVLTIPIKEAVSCIERVPAKVLKAAASLRHNSVRIVLLGVNNDSLLDKSAVYIPEPGCVCHRVCYMGYFSRNNIPKGRSSLIAEISTYKGQELSRISDSSLIQKVINDLSRLRLIRKEDIITTDIQNIEYGYVVYDKDYKKNMRIIRDYFHRIGIILLGRFAQFEYINMDEVISRSMYLAKRLK